MGTFVNICRQQNCDVGTPVGIYIVHHLEMLVIANNSIITIFFLVYNNFF